MYSLAGHQKMIGDPVRMESYVEALRQTVRPGSVVVDLGAGTGVFALWACRLGARRVYAIEPDDVIHVAQEVARANRCADRIEFIQDASTEVSLPERADVIVSDLRGVLPWFENHLPAIADARGRFLAPGGMMIPSRDTLWAAPVKAPELCGPRKSADKMVSDGFDLDLVWRLAANAWQKARVKPEQLLADAQRAATLDYRTVEDPNLVAKVSWTASRAGAAHGLVAWFDTILTEGVGFSNAPTVPEAIYGSAFFPWPESVEVSAGDRIAVELSANLVGTDYLWRWNTCVRDSAGAARAAFQQSTFCEHGGGQLRKRAADYVPETGEQARIDQFVLNLMDGGRSVGEIAHRLLERFPDRFSRREEALARVGELSHRYSR
jgi:protein arginine N-methyltransferase 1